MSIKATHASGTSQENRIWGGIRTASDPSIDPSTERTEAARRHDAEQSPVDARLPVRLPRPAEVHASVRAPARRRLGVRADLNAPVVASLSAWNEPDVRWDPAPLGAVTFR